MVPKISHIFRLTRDPETTITAGGMQVTKLGLAASEKYKDKENVFFIDATAFGKTAEFIASVSKGQRVFVSGRLQTDSWEDKNGGGKRSKSVMIIDSFMYVEAKSNQTQQPNDYAPQGQQQAPQQQGGFSNSEPPF